jgi:hypothetical protein
MPIAETETLTDYLTENSVSSTLSLADLGIPHVMVTKEQVALFFSQDRTASGWKDFYATYPSSSGLLFFSRIGFNSQHNQAFLYVGNSCGGLCGAGSYVLLRKECDSWKIEQEQDLWVS